jgi:hypothetical protein
MNFTTRSGEKKRVFFMVARDLPNSSEGCINNSSGYKYLVFAGSPLHNILKKRSKETIKFPIA